MAMEQRRIGKHEVRITKVYTVEATAEFSDKHDPTPNWRERTAPVVTAGAFHLRVQAEAGETIANNAAVAYSLHIQPVCLTNALAALIPAGFMNAVTPAVAFTAGGWEYQASEEMYTRSWDIAIPFPGGFLIPVWHTNQVWQYFVSLIDSAGAKTVACTAASEPFLLLG